MDSAEKANRRYFRDAYRTGEHGWGIDAPDPSVLRRLDRLQTIVPGGALLDLGCGEGRHAIAAARRGFRVSAVDYEPLALRRARRFARAGGVDGIRFRRANALDLPFAADSFDVIVDFGCLHHQRKRDWPAYRRGLLRVLRPGGWLMLSVFSPRFRLFRGAPRPWHIARGAYRRCFRPADLHALFDPDFDFIELVEERARGRGMWHALLRRKAPPGKQEGETPLS